MSPIAGGGSRWRWQSEPRPVSGDVRSLVASGKLLPHSKKYLFGWSAWTQKVTFSGPMGTAGLQTATGTTGDRPEIGPVTVAQADYIVNGTPLALSTMMAQAEAAASMPIHLRNEATGKFLDFQADTLYATLQLFTASGWAQGGIPDAPAPRDASGNLDPRFFHMDAAHRPSLCYVPYLLTDDPYYLEEVQALATFDIAIAGYHRYAQQLKGLVYPGETRATAWGLRDVAQAALVSPETSWLLPKSYWLANLADNRTFLRRFQTSPAKVHTVFRAYPRVDWVGGFRSDYLSIVLAWLVRMGFTEWSDGYTWSVGGVLPQVSDGTGWLKGWPDPYYYTPFITDPGPITLVPDTSLDGNTYATWADAFARYVADKGSTDDPTLTTYPPAWDGLSIKQTQSAPLYFLQRQAALHLAQAAGLAGATAPAAWLNTQMTGILAQFGVTSDPRWSLEP